jgi:EmrB/QacA subfamily drug resistance transporter
MNKELTQKQKRNALAGVVLGLLLASLDSTIVGTSMPKIVASLGGMERYTWVATVYMLAMTIAMPISGKLNDMIRRKKLFLAGIGIFLTGSALCGMSGSMSQLIAFRGFQGIGAGVLMSSAFILIGDIFPPLERARYQGVLGAVFALSSLIGPSLGGILSDSLGWRWTFFVNLPAGAAALMFIATTLPNRTLDCRDKSLDIAGILTLIASILPLMLAFSLAGKTLAWNSTEITGLLAFGTVMTVVFLLVESKARNPVIPLSLFKNRTFNISSIGRFMASAGLYGAVMFIPLFMQKVLGTSATSSGIVTTPLTLMMLFASVITGQIIAKTRKYKFLAIFGFLLMAAGMFLSSRMGAGTTKAAVILNMVITGFGLGISAPIFILAVQNSLPREQLGVATSSVQFFGNVGGTIGMAAMGSLVDLGLLKQGKLEEFTRSLDGVFLFGMLIALMAMAACFFLKEKHFEDKITEKAAGAAS